MVDYSFGPSMSVAGATTAVGFVSYDIKGYIGLIMVAAAFGLITVAAIIIRFTFRSDLTASDTLSSQAIEPEVVQPI